MKIQLGHSFDEIISLENLLSAWQEFIIGKKSKPDVQMFSRDLMDNIISLHADLKNGAYRHGGYESFFINDPKRRHIHKASVRDRLVHHAIYRILYPFFDRTFVSDSFSCRLDKGTHKALNRFRAMAYQVSKNHTRTCWVLKCDIRKFFASIDHKVLLDVLGEYVSDKNVMELLIEIVESYPAVCPARPISVIPAKAGIQYGVNSSGVPYNRRLDPHFHGDDRVGVGLPLGNLTSQLFANVYMNVFDQWMKHKLKVKHYIRYADDFVVLSEDKLYLVNLIAEIRDFLLQKLKLSLHSDKVFIKSISSGVDFLGWVHFPHYRKLRAKTKQRMFRRLMEIPRPEVLQSYLGLLSHGNTYKIKQELLNFYWFRTDSKVDYFTCIFSNFC